MPEILDNWTVAQAWEHCHGSRRRPRPEDISDKSLCEIDAVVASYFGEETLEGRKKAAAAMQYLCPRLLTSQLPPGPEERKRQHVAAVATQAVKNYCREDGMPATCYRHLVRCLRRWELGELDTSDWYLIWDSLGVSGKNATDMLTYKFYEFAGQHVRYSKW
jgi:hypothetical protein